MMEGRKRKPEDLKLERERIFNARTRRRGVFENGLRLTESSTVHCSNIPSFQSRCVKGVIDVE